jgi:hypothetical protein
MKSCGVPCQKTNPGFWLELCQGRSSYKPLVHIAGGVRGGDDRRQQAITHCCSQIMRRLIITAGMPTPLFYTLNTTES